MLNLVRRPGESVIIDDDITVTVLDVQGRRVRIGFEAPENVSVHRREVYERIKLGLPPNKKPVQ